VVLASASVAYVQVARVGLGACNGKIRETRSISFEALHVEALTGRGVYCRTSCENINLLIWARAEHTGPC
jgi:hypothetical protein